MLINQFIDSFKRIFFFFISFSDYLCLSQNAQNLWTFSSYLLLFASENNIEFLAIHIKVHLLS